MLTVETETNGVSKSTNERGPSWLARWAPCAGTRDFCLALTALVRSVKNSIFPHRTYILVLCPHRPASWAGSRDGSPVFYVCLCGTIHVL